MFSRGQFCSGNSMFNWKVCTNPVQGCTSRCVTSHSSWICRWGERGRGTGSYSGMRCELVAKIVRKRAQTVHWWQSSHDSGVQRKPPINSINARTSSALTRQRVVQRTSRQKSRAGVIGPDDSPLFLTLGSNRGRAYI